jgi:hypothetical protein
MNRWLVFLLGVAVLVVGCNSSAGLPKTYPAGGSVVYKGGQPMKGGSIQFSSLANAELRIIGPIGDDGTFKLETVRDRARADGAPEGEYQVMVIPPLQGDHKGSPPIILPRPYKVEPKENQFKIELPIPPPRAGLASPSIS